jgi:hypothetical protein
MGEDPAAIREAIEETRERMGETLQELAGKADVKGRAKDWVQDKKQAAAERLDGTKEAVASRLEQIKESAQDGNGQVDVRAMGKAGLTGVRAKVAERVSGPVAARTGLSEDQVEAVIGALFLALAVVQFVRLMRRVARAGREGA